MLIYFIGGTEKGGYMLRLIKRFLKTIRSNRGDFGGGSEDSASQGITDTGNFLYNAGKMTGNEEDQSGRSFALGCLS